MAAVVFVVTLVGCLWVATFVLALLSLLRQNRVLLDLERLRAEMRAWLPTRARAVTEAAQPEPEPEPAVPRPWEPEPLPLPEPPPIPVRPAPAPASAAPAFEPVPKPAPAAAPPEPRREEPLVESAAADLLRRIRNWILFGAEQKPTGPGFEQAVAAHWLLRVGVLALVVGVGLFLRYSIEQGWITPVGRVSLSILAGLGLLTTGLRLLGKRYHLLGQGLVGAGLAILYFSFYAAATLHNLIPLPAAFALMALVTVSAGLLAVRLDSVLIAILGIVGGYGTPVLLSTGTANFLVLYSYITLLGVGILGIAHYRQWLLLNWLGFLGTYSLFLASVSRYYQEADFWQVMPFLVVFFLLYSALVVLHNLVHRKPTTLLEVIGLVANAAVFFGSSYGLIAGAFDTEWVALASFALAALYIGLVLLFLRRGLGDRALLLVLLALAAFFVTITIPLLLSQEWITVSWALQALLMVWLGSKLKSRFLVHLSYVLYALVLVRLGGLDLWRLFRSTAPALTAYWPDLLTRMVVFGTAIGSFAGGCLLQRRPPEAGAVTVRPDTDVPAWIPAKRAGWTLFWLALATGFVYVHIELSQFFELAFAPLRLPMLTLLWAGLCVGLLVAHERAGRRHALLVLACCAAAVLLVKFVAFDLASWNLAPGAMRYGAAPYRVLDACMRLLDYVLIGAVFCWAALAFGRRRMRSLHVPFALVTHLLLFGYLTLELNTFLAVFLPGFRAGGVSILWSVYALALVTWGLRRDLRSLRFTGLALFALVALKVVFSDLARLDPVFRFTSFIALGILVLIGSFLYVRNSYRFSARPPGEEESSCR